MDETLTECPSGSIRLPRAGVCLGVSFFLQSTALMSGNCGTDARSTSMMLFMPIVRIVKQKILLGALATIIVAAHPTDSSAQSGGACAESTSASAKFYRDYYRNAVSSSEAHVLRFRADTRNSEYFTISDAICR